MEADSLSASLQPATHVARLAVLPLVQPLRERDFRLLWLGESISVLGTQFHFVALPWLVLKLTGSGLALGTVLMTAAVPRALFMLFGGALSDRFSPRRLMLASNLARGVLVAALAALVVGGHLSLLQLCVFSFLFGVADAFFYPAYTAMLPFLLSPERLAAGNALLQGSAQLYGLFGPAAGGLLISAAGLAPVFGIDSATFFFAAWMLGLIRGGHLRSALPKAHAAPGMLAEVREGIRYAWRDPLLRVFLYVTASLNFAFVGPFVVGTAALAGRRFSGATALGIMLSALAAGGLVGTLLAGFWRNLRRRGWMVVGVLAVVTAGLAVLPLARSVWIAAAIIFPVGLVGGLTNITIVTWIQQTTAPQMLGRVMSLVMVNAVALTPFSYILAGALVDVGIPTLFLVAAGLMVVVLVRGAASVALRRWD